MLSGKKVVLGVTGGIAAYKAAELLRLFVRQGMQVRVVMTQAATQFVAPLTFQALSGQPVQTQLVDAASEAAMGHIELARWADVIVIAPMTADFMARLIHGRADDLLCAVCLASEAPLWVAPAMNNKMWSNAATQENLAALVARGVRVIGPGEGEQACGETGLGRMSEPTQIFESLQRFYENGALRGLRVVVSAGPTREPIDPVRYISNRSSGKMGYAVARAAREAGAQVTLISGPVNLATPSGVTRINVESAVQMAEAVKQAMAACDIFISAAAVADYRVKQRADQKIKKNAEDMTLELVRNPDILADVTQQHSVPFVVGFAAETENLLQHAKDKLQRKRLDMVIANDVSQGDRGFDVDTNQVTIVWTQGETTLPLMSKQALAGELIDIIAARYHAKNSA